MKVKIKASENYQEVSCELEVEDFNEITECIKSLRKAIIDATQDVIDKKSKKEEKPQILMASQGQIRYLHNLGWKGNEKELTFDEASNIISQMGGGKLRGQ